MDQLAAWASRNPFPAPPIFLSSMEGLQKLLYACRGMFFLSSFSVPTYTSSPMVSLIKPFLNVPLVLAHHSRLIRFFLLCLSHTEPENPQSPFAACAPTLPVGLGTEVLYPSFPWRIPRLSRTGHHAPMSISRGRSNKTSQNGRLEQQLCIVSELWRLDGRVHNGSGLVP